jgi:[acyl-carrier-protein] S-malonyltransferase
MGMNFAGVFPGQGSQSVGMLAALAQAEPVVAQTFEEASQALGYDLWQLCQSGPEQRLNATEQTQPAMLAAGVAVWRVWRARGGALPSLSAGHSLGEYSALVASGALAFAQATGLVQARGRFMQEAVPAGQGAIAAVLGLDDATVVDVCAAVCTAREPEIVSAVNFNAPGQVVIAGHAAAVGDALERLRQAGARKAVPLPMSVPVHCELMRPAAERLKARLLTAGIAAPAIPVLHNADLRAHDDPGEIVDALTAQLYTPVRWTRTVEAFAAQDLRMLIEFGPGRVLTGLAKRIERTITALAVHDPASLDAALAATQEAA